MSSSTPLVRFFSKLDKTTSPKGCWIYQGPQRECGESVFSIGRTSIQSHRYSWEFFFGPIPKGQFVLHECGDKRCCNPSHLFLGGKQDTFPAKRFLDKVDIPENPKDCWLYTGPYLNKGYGAFSIKRKSISAHRYSYELFKGPIEKGKFVCHTCDNPKCVNPDHLWIGTHTDNMRDKISKGRHISGKAPMTKHLDSIEQELLSLFDAGVSIAEIARKFELKYATAQTRILNIRQKRGDKIASRGRRR